MIILVFLCVKKFSQEQNEYFENVEQIQSELQNSVESEQKEMAMKGRISDLETTVADLKEVLNLGFLPSVNDFQQNDKSQPEQIFFPAKRDLFIICSI